ncbi:TraE/TraK family type IV conjugative transfer system protein [Neisseria musculi]|uniref:TraE family protein n=1 Tax=Neisseria musculi TaxID=1815583 RepID=A0A7H1M8Q6_9NEIS|nr:TraE/TraK family type IV conjugative transfer system protein [Neisseria musculi]QNT58021.1 traE family protein [Neisseria musculi]
MEFNKAKARIKQHAKDLFSKASINTVLALSLLGMVIYQLTVNKETILVPPHLSEEAVVSRNHASKEYYQPFVQMVVGSISAATPENADEVYKWTRKFFIDEVWANLGPQILAIKTNPKFNGINLMSYFSIEGIEYEPRTEIFYVYGKLTSAQYRKGRIQPVRSIYATYEVRMEMFAGVPKVTHWRPYEGVPMTQIWKEKHPELAKKREAELEKTVENHQTHPHADEEDIVQEKDYSITDDEAADSMPASEISKSDSQQPPESTASQIMRGVQPPAPTGSPANSQDDLL